MFAENEIFIPDQLSCLKTFTDKIIDEDYDSHEVYRLSSRSTNGANIQANYHLNHTTQNPHTTYDIVAASSAEPDRLNFASRTENTAGLHEFLAQLWYQPSKYEAAGYLSCQFNDQQLGKAILGFKHSNSIQLAHIRAVFHRSHATLGAHLWKRFTGSYTVEALAESDLNTTSQNKLEIRLGYKPTDRYGTYLSLSLKNLLFENIGWHFIHNHIHATTKNYSLVLSTKLTKNKHISVAAGAQILVSPHHTLRLKCSHERKLGLTHIFTKGRIELASTLALTHKRHQGWDWKFGYRLSCNV